MTDPPQLLLAHHLKALKLPTFLREYDKLAQQCATEGVDHPRYLLARDAMWEGQRRRPPARSDISPSMHDIRWLFFDLGCTLVDEEAAHERRLQLLVEALVHHGRRCSIDEARAALAAAWAEFASRPIIKAIERLVNGDECRRAVLAAARYPKELEAPLSCGEAGASGPARIVQAGGHR